MNKIKKTIAFAVAIAAIVATMVAPIQASASSWTEPIQNFLWRNQATSVCCGNSCILPFGMHRYACPKCDSTNYTVIETKYCINDWFNSDRCLYYEYRQCVCGNRYKGPQFK